MAASQDRAVKYDWGSKLGEAISRDWAVVVNVLHVVEFFLDHVELWPVAGQ